MFLGCCGVRSKKRWSWMGLDGTNPPQQSPHTDRCSWMSAGERIHPGPPATSGFGAAGTAS
jgi:hypothetical protein